MEQQVSCVEISFIRLVSPRFCLSGHISALHSPLSAIPKVVIDAPRPGYIPPNHHNHIPDRDEKRTTTTRPPMTQKRIFPVITKATTAKATTTAKVTTITKATTTPKMTTTSTSPTTAPPPTKRVAPPTYRPEVVTRKPFVATKKPPAPTRKPYIPPPPPPPVTPVDNTIQKEVTKQRGDVHSKIELLVSLNVDAFCLFSVSTTKEEEKKEPSRRGRGGGYLHLS